MNFFERQRQVRKMSARLVILFALAVIGIVITVDLVVVLVFGGLNQPPEAILGLVLVATALILTLIGLSSLFRSLSLRSGGGSRVARAMGAVPVPQDPADFQLRRLRNVVEEIAIASGTPVPDLYVMESEQGINAFAAGWSPSDAAIAVTRGALDRLNREELQGVIAHEFSHVVNGDMRLNIKLMGLLFGILVLYIVGRILLHVRGGNRNPVPLIGLALIVCGGIGILVGRTKENLRPFRFANVRLKYADGSLGLPEVAPFDTIIVAAAAREVPLALKQQLAPGGRMMIPLGSSDQRLMLVEREGNVFKESRFEAVRFVPLLNGME